MATEIERKMAPRGTFAFFNRLYTDSGGWTPLGGNPQIETRDSSLGFILERDPREELDSWGNAIIEVWVYQRIRGFNERYWRVGIDNGDGICSFESRLVLEKGENPESFDPPVKELSEVLGLVRLTLKEIKTHGGTITPNFGYNEAAKLRARRN